MDSTLTVVETAKPGCATQAAQLRQVAWSQTMNAALQALNAQKPDTAVRYAERALVVYKADPLPYYVLAVTAQQKGDAERWRQIGHVLNPAGKKKPIVKMGFNPSR